MKLANPVTFECRCGNTHNSIGATLPPGWTNKRGVTRCDDCRSAARAPLARQAA